MKLAALLVAAVVLLSGAAGATPLSTLDVTLDPTLRTASGRAIIDVDNDGAAPLSTVELWLWPERLARRSPALDERNFYWVYPRSFNPGGIRIAHLTADGAPAPCTILDHPQAGAKTLAVITLPRPIPPGGRVRIAADFATRIPIRYGAFGCYHDTCTLAGGFHPMLVARRDGAWDRSAPPARSDYDATLRHPPDTNVHIGAAPLPADNHVTLRDAPYLLTTISKTTSPPLVARETVHRGVRIRLVHPPHRLEPPSDVSPPPGRGMPYLVEDRAALILAAAREALDLLAEEGLPIPPGATLPFVEAPLRMELAAPHGQAILVSDQLFRIMPLAKFRKFHEFQLVRAIFAFLVEQRLAPRERADDLGWSPDVAASWLVDRYTLREYRKAEFAQNILRWVSFIPTVDRILYAPQVQFATAYFNTLDDPDPTRDDPRRFANRRPRGKTIYEKLRDLLGDESTARVARALFAGTPIRAAAESESHKNLDTFFAQWLGPYPEVDYRFRVLGADRNKDGFRYRIRIWKEGGTSPSGPPTEPVELAVVEWNGARHVLKWDGAGSEHVFTLQTRWRIRTVILDPRGRLLQHIESRNEDLRVDDYRPSRFKFIYNNFGALINFQTGRFDLSLDFSLNHLYDTKNFNRFAIYRSPSTQVGGLASYSRGFGRRVTPSRLTSAASVSLRLARLEPRYGRELTAAPVPGTQLSLGAGIGYDDRFFIWDPVRSTSIGASAAYVLTVPDSGTPLHQVTVAAEFGRLEPIATGHGVAFEVGAAATFGDLRSPSQMLSAGAPGTLRGYEPDELLGRLRAHVRGEYRHTFVHDLNINFLHILFLRGIAGAVFTEAGVISPCESYNIGARDVFGDVGYSLRLFADWLGVSQTVFNVDVAVPLVRRSRGCFAEPTTRERAPIGVFVYFGPVW